MFRYLLFLLVLAGTYTNAWGQKALFPEIDTNYAGKTVSLPGSPFKYSVLFRQDESIVKTSGGKQGLARGNHDFTGYIPINGSSQHGYVIVNHELSDSNSTFGDGGGMTVFEAKVINGEWQVVGDYRNVDFSSVGGTFVNCGGAQVPNGHVLTAEEYPPASTEDLYKGGVSYRDTTDVMVSYDGKEFPIKRYENMGWMVEVDPANAQAVRKLWKMGRYSHEGAYVTNGGKTVYLSDDNSPGVFFKFEAEVANDFTEGQLYAYKQSGDGKGGEWLSLPMDFDSLKVIRDVAIGRGATLFVRLEWITEANGKIYITETGRDGFNWDGAVAQGGVPAQHLDRVRISKESYSYEDYYGRILEFDPATNRIRSYLEGGYGIADRSRNLSNPDGLVTMEVNGEEWLIINEDLNGRSAGRVSPEAEAAGRTICEIYAINPKIEYPTVDNLKRLLIGPNGAETTGGRPTPDGKSYFVNIQHPSGSNPEPFDKSATIVVTGFGDYIAGETFNIFPPIDTTFAGETVVIPANPYEYKVLFRQDESIVKTSGGKQGLARGNHDFTGYIPINGSSQHGYVIVNHELSDSNSTFGDGGGMTVFEAKVINGEWQVVGDYRNVDFSSVGGTFVNCGGAQVPNGHVLTAEEYPPASTEDLYKGGVSYRDTTDVMVSYDGKEFPIKRYENMGWMVEVDPANAQAVRKLWKMGRYSHEGAYVTNGGKTVYLSDDNSPGVFFKFEAEVANDFTEGQLYAYKQSGDGKGGEWLSLPMDFDSLKVIRDVAIGRGATLFVRLEWITEANGKIYITETGRDGFNWDGAVAQGGVPAQHLSGRKISGTSYSYEDYYGRILEFDPATNRVRAYLEGGNSTWDPGTNLSNPDGLVTVSIEGKEWLIINEDLNGRSAGRVSPEAEAAGRTICEIYVLDASLKNPTVDDLKRLLIGPNGAETTGGRPTPDGKSYFVNIQHPSGSNPEPFNKSATIVLTGFADLSSVVNPGVVGNPSFRIYPNPTIGTLNFSKKVDVAIYNAKGEQIRTAQGVEALDVSDLTPGAYYVQTIEGNVVKLIVE
ncbi:MAG: alkaline phosphatase PhoX [Candidatus Kapaibacterium sp.]